MSTAFCSVVDIESQATMLLDAHGVITYLDRNIAKVFDYAAHELVGQQFTRLLAAPFDAHYAQLLSNLAAAQREHNKQLQGSAINFSTPSSRLVEARTKRGEMFLVAVYLSLLVERDVPVFVVAVERAKQPVGVLTACKGVVVSCNTDCERIFGFLPGELVGKRVASLVAATADLQRLRVVGQQPPDDDVLDSSSGSAGANAAAANAAATGADEDQMTLYVDFLQSSRSRKRSAAGELTSVNLVAGTPVPPSAPSLLHDVDDDEDEDDEDGENDGDELDNHNGAAAAAAAGDEFAADGAAIAKATSTAIGQTFRAVELETECVDKLGRHFNARVHLQRKRMGVVELFRGFIQPLDGGDMTVMLITDDDGQVLSTSQVYCKPMLGYTPQELCRMNINELILGLPALQRPPGSVPPTPSKPPPPVYIDNANDDDDISVAAPGIKLPRQPQQQQPPPVYDAAGSPSQLESVLREGSTISSSTSSLAADEDDAADEVDVEEVVEHSNKRSNSAPTYPDVQVVADDDDEDEEEEEDEVDEKDRAAAVARAAKNAAELANTVKRARALHGGYASSATPQRRTLSNASPNFALTLGRRTTARHKSGAEVSLQMDVMRFLSHDGQVRFSVRLYSLANADNNNNNTGSASAPASTTASATAPAANSRRGVSGRHRSGGGGGTSSAPAPASSSARPQVQFLGEWMLSRELGRGSFATVRLGTHVQSGQQCAIKLFLLAEGTAEEREHVRRLAVREAQLLELVRGHRNIVALHDVIEGEAAGGGTALVIEFVPGGELFTEIVSRGGLDEAAARALFAQLADAVRHCHALRVAHRDLKHQNVLTDGHGRVVLIDFGLAIAVDRCSDPSEMRMGAGTPAYAAPEMLRGSVTDPMASDIWSLGVVLYSMVMADFPFRNVAEVLGGQFQPSRAPRLSAPLLDLLSRMLVHEPTQRADIGAVLQHPWLTTGT